MSITSLGDARAGVIICRNLPNNRFIFDVSISFPERSMITKFFSGDYFLFKRWGAFDFYQHNSVIHKLLFIRDLIFS
ncbi:MAG: hypothetical protein IGNPGNKH_00276 [Sodalis sp. Ffu]|nr:MAG: hypothetical protein IGNPGNKH_00276 [Sodalis sp. Ffu]